MSQHRSIIVALFVVLLTTPISSARADGNIIVAAQETVATVSPRSPRLKLVNLPRLEFALRAAIQCKGIPVSVTLSVADTFKTIGGNDLEGQRAAEITLSVPPRQLALAASSRFCIADDPDSADELLVDGFTTAHASLRCQTDDRTSAHFASAPLKVRLTCAREDEEDQAPSSDGEPR